MLAGNMLYHGALEHPFVKLFDFTAASTGLSEKVAREAGFDVGISYVFRDHHVTYYPGRQTGCIKAYL